MEEIKLLGKIVIKGIIKAKTGLTIGGSTVGLDIGGVDNPVIKDAKGKPYIPGSSLKGKMRSLLEKAEGKPLTKNLGGSRIHVCEKPEDYQNCHVCKIFGVPGKEGFGEPTRIIVRDAFLIDESITEEMKKNLDLEYTEVKFENVIDRITSAANPRQTERVPAGAQFEFEMIYNVFDEKDKENLKEVFKTMKLLEDDYLGSSGSRGYGKIEFKDVKIYWNSIKNYEEGKTTGNENIIYEQKEDEKIDSILNKFDEMKTKIRD